MVNVNRWLVKRNVKAEKIQRFWLHLQTIELIKCTKQKKIQNKEQIQLATKLIVKKNLLMVIFH